jgi:hypothetical protein
MDFMVVRTKMKIQMAEHEERKEKAYHSAKLYKEQQANQDQAIQAGK